MTGLRRRPRSAALLRLAYRVAYVLLRGWSAAARPNTRGVKCVLRDADGRALFVKHAYGTRSNWELPGGGARRGEPPLDAARREAREELGVTDAAWELAGTVAGEWHGKHERLDVFVCAWEGGRLAFDRVEIATAAWFPLSDPPFPLGPSTRTALTTFR